MRKFRSVVAVLLIFLVNCLAYAVTESEAALVSSHRLNTAELGFKLSGDGSRVRFQSDYIYLGDGDMLWSYIGDDTLRFYNIRMDASATLATWSVTVSGPANVTVTRFFVGRRFEADIVAETAVTSTTKITCRQPSNVEGADSYSWQNNLLTLNVNHQSSRHITVTFNPLSTFVPQLIDGLTSILSVSLIVAVAILLLGNIAPEKQLFGKEITRYSDIMLGLCLLAALLSVMGLLYYI